MGVFEVYLLYGGVFVFTCVPVYYAPVYVILLFPLYKKNLESPLYSSAP